MHRYYHPEVGVPDVFAPAGPRSLSICRRSNYTIYFHSFIKKLVKVSLQSSKSYESFRKKEKKETLKDPAEHTTYQRYDLIYDDIHLTLRTFCDLRKLF